VSQRSATILVVDDEEPLRDFLALLLQDLGHRVLQAINGREALELARAEHPDLVISDVMMPVMGGVELSHQLKDNVQGASGSS
jgi:two-component system cell cycle sensor histidine kinase/response regulator CckA